MTRNPYRPRLLSFWAKEAIAALSLLIVACLFLWAAPLILEAMVE